MRFVVYGAGAIGGLLAGRLLQGRGDDVVLVARGAQYEAIRSGGLQIKAADGCVETVDIPVVDRIDAIRLRPDDVVLLAVKSQDTLVALRGLAETAPDGVAVACVQNGVENERVAARFFEHVYGVVIMCPAIYLQPGLVENAAAPQTGILDIGRYPKGRDSRAEAISGALRSATYISDVRSDVMSWKYAKLLVNLDNVLEALAGPDAVGSRLAESLRMEGEVVLRTAGKAFIAHEQFQARAQLLSWNTRSVVNSTVQSIRRGTGSIETDYLNGEIVRLARSNGISAPANELVQRLARRLVHQKLKVGSVTVDEIAKQLKRRSSSGS